MRALVVLLLTGVLLACAKTLPPPAVPAPEPPPPAPAPPVSEVMPMKLDSPVFEANGRIPTKFTCVGKDVSPPLRITDAPPSAKSLALIMDDPDAPAGTWVHWVEWNIPPGPTTIAEAAGRLGVQGTNSWGKRGYGGPCPPSGAHRYFFKVYALDAMLTLPEGTQKSGLLAAMEGHILAQAELVGLYSKQY